MKNLLSLSFSLLILSSSTLFGAAAAAAAGGAGVAPKSFTDVTLACAVPGWKTEIKEGWTAQNQTPATQKTSRDAIFVSFGNKGVTFCRGSLAVALKAHGIDVTKITGLGLEGLPLAALEDGDLDELTRLVEIDLSDAKAPRTLGDEVFAKLANLQVLHLSDGGLSKLPTDLPLSLKYLELSRCKLTLTPAEEAALVKLVQNALRMLSLNGNAIVHVPHALFAAILASKVPAFSFHFAGNPINSKVSKENPYGAEGVESTALKMFFDAYHTMGGRSGVMTIDDERLDIPLEKTAPAE